MHNDVPQSLRPRGHIMMFLVIKSLLDYSPHSKDGEE